MKACACNSLAVLLCATCLAICGCGSRQPPPGDEEQGAGRRETNAALHYWSAFALVEAGRKAALNDETIIAEEIELGGYMATGKGMPNDSEIAFLQKVDSAFPFLEAAFNADHCDWQLAEIRSGTLRLAGAIEITQRSHEIASFADLKIKMLCVENRPREAFQLGMAVIQLGRNISGIPNGSAAGVNIETFMMRRVAQEVSATGKIDAAMIKTFQSLKRPDDSADVAALAKVDRALFLAGLEVIVHGRNALNLISDPSNDRAFQPFEIVESEDGFRLRSASGRGMAFGTSAGN